MENRKQLAKKGLISIAVFLITLFFIGGTETGSNFELIISFVMLFSWLTAGISLYKLDVMKNKAALICLIVFLNFLYLFYAEIFILPQILKEEE
ncbi:MAG: hypothetical protein PUA51_08295 [Oscillospiraceae bacterium]|nr:hypothetical protein [Oscillospiraceae bacterium]